MMLCNSASVGSRQPLDPANTAVLMVGRKSVNIVPLPYEDGKFLQQSGKCPEEWITEYQCGMPHFKELRKEAANHRIEKVGARLRALMPWLVISGRKPNPAAHHSSSYVLQPDNILCIIASTMAAKDNVAERIRYLTDLLRLFWVSLLAIGGGTAGLLLGELGVLKGIFATAGIVVLAVSVAVVVRLDVRIRGLIEELKEV
jgi:hypothetical protein